MNISRLVWLISFFSMAGLSAAETEYPLNSTNSTDIWITSYYSYNDNYGVNDERLRVGGWADYYHSLIKFDISSLPADATSVKLLLFCYSNDNASNVGMDLDVVTSPWDNSTGWYSPSPTTTYLKTLDVPAVGSWYAIELTELYKQWKSGAIPNHGIQLRPLGIAHEFNEFRSSEYAADPTLRPKLVIATPDAKYNLKFPLPAPYGPTQISSDFGAHWLNRYCGTQRLLHTGVDFPANFGTEVRAAESGIVRLARKSQEWGGYVVIEHNGPTGIFTTIYEHLEPITKKDKAKDKDKTTPKEHTLKEGDVVEKGELIGKLVAGTEEYDGHLHFQLREAGYASPISIRGRLPEGASCDGDPAFPELFYDPKKVNWQ